MPKFFCIEHGHVGVEALKPAVRRSATFDTESFVNSFYIHRDVAAAAA
jgi:hypothetical protein